MIYLERILKCVEESGITIDEKGEMINVESLNFISAIISLEEEFGIEFPSELLSYEKVDNISRLKDLIEELCRLK